MQILGKIGLGIAVFVIMSPAILFFVWMASLSVKFEVDNASYPPIFIPDHFAWKNYADVLASNRFLTYFENSLLVTGTATLLAMLVGVPAGYGIARMAAHKSAIVILIARITPGLSYLIPLFLLFQWLGLLGTLWPQIIIHLVVTVPIVIWIMIGYFETTPLELEEAAFIDGATRWQVFRHVALPIARPGMAVAFILAVIFSWNNFVFGIVLAGRETRTLPVAVYNMISFDQLSWGPLAAAALIVTLPVLLLTDVRPAPDRRRADRRRRQGRLSRSNRRFHCVRRATSHSCGVLSTLACIRIVYQRVLRLGPRSRARPPAIMIRPIRSGLFSRIAEDSGGK